MEEEDDLPLPARHQCPVCEKSYTISSNLYKHIRARHDIPPNERIVPCKSGLKCAICHLDLLSTASLFKHMVSEHGIEFETQSFTFHEDSHFQEWKRKLELDYNCRYVKKSGSKTRPDGTKIYHYVCHRSGLFSGRGKGMRSMKKVGSNKINATCPARIKVSETANLINVEYMPIHVGHDHEISRILLNDTEKQIIATKLSLGESITEILDQVRQMASPETPRFPLTTRRDVLNIINQYNINYTDPDPPTRKSTNSAKKTKLKPGRTQKIKKELEQVTADESSSDDSNIATEDLDLLQLAFETQNVQVMDIEGMDSETVLIEEVVPECEDIAELNGIESGGENCSNPSYPVTVIYDLTGDYQPWQLHYSPSDQTTPVLRENVKQVCKNIEHFISDESLSHNNIAQIYGVLESAYSYFLSLKTKNEAANTVNSIS